MLEKLAAFVTKIRLNGTGKYTVHPEGCGPVANEPLLLLVMVV